MPRIVTAKPPQRGKRKKPAKPTPVAAVVKARSPAQIKRAKRIEKLRERGY